MMDADGTYEVIRIPVERVSYLIALLDGIPHKHQDNEAMVRNVRAVFATKAE